MTDKPTYEQLSIQALENWINNELFTQSQKITRLPEGLPLTYIHLVWFYVNNVLTQEQLDAETPFEGKTVRQLIPDLQKWLDTEHNLAPLVKAKWEAFNARGNSSS